MGESILLAFRNPLSPKPSFPAIELPFLAVGLRRSSESKGLPAAKKSPKSSKRETSTKFSIIFELPFLAVGLRRSSESKGLPAAKKSIRNRANGGRGNEC
ncbi:hypothetical protein CEXT_167231 [Caerostris extrusa]|uniref:Uncharacterized protein n=1 Tax=Caerostris extrusa TaxID=172846 RepID=A0AAV4TF51_CAEEX|nr:hypothetical protein CEXT_167231 [Caerostris extrusa]